MARRLTRLGIVLLALGCTRVHRLPSTSALASSARATIGERAARFVFPVEVSDRISWPGNPPHAYPGYPLRFWEVGWDYGLHPDRVGKDPDGILVLLKWQKEPTRLRALADLLKGMHPEVLTFCNSCDGPAEASEENPAVSLLFEGNRVVILVRGEDAIKKIFPHETDSVTFSRTRPAGDDNDDDDDKESWTVAVEHSET